MAKRLRGYVHSMTSHRRKQASGEGPAFEIDVLRDIPSITRLLNTEQARVIVAIYGREEVVAALRAEVEQIRNRILAAVPIEPSRYSPAELVDAAVRRLARSSRLSLRRVINAAGIVIHTNLGRAPLPAEAAQAAYDAASHYSSLELDLETGRRGARNSAIQDHLRALTGADAALVVNNNAAAVLLAIATLASDGEVIVSRGELVEIGGAFRIPDVVGQSGARLVEVGATNKTRLADYALACGPETRLLLKVHASNFRIVGFTADVPIGDLVRLGRANGLPALYDLGSGALLDFTRMGLPAEPSVPDAVAAGADVATFSGDKLLGGPQCGVIVGKADLVARMGRHPLYRAVRVDKMTLAALEATLRIYRNPARAAEAIPVLRMLATPIGALIERAERLAAALSAIDGVCCRTAEGSSFAGGGSMPENPLPTRLVRASVRGFSATALAGALRQQDLPVIGIIDHDSFVLDVRTIVDDEIPEIAAAFYTASRRA